MFCKAVKDIILQNDKPKGNKNCRRRGSFTHSTDLATTSVYLVRSVEYFISEKIYIKKNKLNKTFQNNTYIKIKKFKRGIENVHSCYGVLVENEGDYIFIHII